MMTLETLLEQSLKKHKEKTALKTARNEFTYKNLSDYSDLIDSEIERNTKQKKQKIVFLLDSGIEFLASMIFSIKKKFVFIPINSDEPIERINHIIGEINPNYIFASSKSSKLLNRLHIKGRVKEICKDEFQLFIYKCNMQTEYVTLNDDDCYIYFSSGTTGKPKGVVGNSKSLSQFISWEIERFNLSADLTYSQLTPTTFDPYLRETLVPLCTGGTICIPDRSVFYDMRELLYWLDNINVIHTIPSLFRALLGFANDTKIFSETKYIFLAGEMLYGNDISSFYNKNLNDDVQLINLYGPTETTLAKFYYPINIDDNNEEFIPVGVPIDDTTTAYILDEQRRKLTNGQVGEIYICTQYASNGYYKNDVLNEEKFFVSCDDSKKLMFKTNDVGRFDELGRLIVLGRLDNLVKINGIQVYPEEIEAVIMQHENIKNVVVFAIEQDKYNKVLCACLETKGNILLKELKNFILAKLPIYMVPTNMLVLDEIPLNSHGKNDRKKAVENYKMIVSNKNQCFENDAKRAFFIEYYQNYINSLYVDEQVDFNSSLDIIGFSSLSYIQFIVVLEEEFDIEFPLECLDINYFENLDAVLTYVKNYK